jgi:hypothetical protein
MGKITILILSLIVFVVYGLTLVSAQGIPGSGQGAQLGLNVTGISFSDDNPIEGDEITITATLSNIGIRTVDNVAVNFQLDQQQAIGNITGISIGAGETENVSITWTAEKWDHSITGMILMGGTPIMDSALTVLLEVQAEPIGDTTSLFLTLGIIILIIILAIFAPSIWFRIRTRR